MHVNKPLISTPVNYDQQGFQTGVLRAPNSHDHSSFYSRLFSFRGFLISG